MKEYKTTFQNTEVSYAFSGEGPVVVWLHGFMEDKSIWKEQLAYFDRFTTNICIDSLGHGKTGSLIREESHTMELQAKSVLSVLDQLQINVFSVVGHSMGGYIGLCLLDFCPDRVSHFVLLNSTSLADTIEKKQNRLRAIKIVENQKEMYCRLGVINLFAKKARTLYVDQIESLVKIAQKTSVQGIKLALLGMMERESKQQLLKEYNGEKLIVAGVSDPVLPIEMSRDEAQFVEAQFVTLKGGHMSYLESGEQLNEILKLFLNI